MDTFVNRLMILAKDCSFADVTAIDYKKKSDLQSFISGLEDPYIRQRMLEKDLNLVGALEAAKILKPAKIDAGRYETENNQTAVFVANKIESKCDLNPETTVNSEANFDYIAAVSRTSKLNNTKFVKCQKCGIHYPVRKCPAFRKACFNCEKLNNYAEF